MKTTETLEEEDLELQGLESGSNNKITKIEPSTHMSPHIFSPVEPKGKTHFCLRKRIGKKHQFENIQLTLKGRVISKGKAERILITQNSTKLGVKKRTNNKSKGHKAICWGLKRQPISETTEPNSEEPVRMAEELNSEEEDELRIQVEKRSKSQNNFRWQQPELKKVKTENILFTNSDEEEFDLAVSEPMEMRKTKSMFQFKYSDCPPAPHNTTSFICQLRELPPRPNFDRFEETSEEGEEESFDPEVFGTMKSMAGKTKILIPLPIF